MKSRAVFFDRDDTIIRNVPYLGDPRQVEVLPGVPEALKKLRAQGFLLFIASNQSGVGRGLITREQVADVNHEMIRQLGEPFFTAIYNSYASPEDPYCEDRKPSPFLVFQARDEHDLDLAASYFVGDKLLDIQCGHNSGCKSVLVLTGTELSHADLQQARTEADHTCKTLLDAGEWISSQPEKRGAAPKPEKTSAAKKPKAKARK